WNLFVSRILAKQIEAARPFKYSVGFATIAAASVHIIGFFMVTYCARDITEFLRGCDEIRYCALILIVEVQAVRMTEVSFREKMAKRHDFVVWPDPRSRDFELSWYGYMLSNCKLSQLTPSIEREQRVIRSRFDLTT